MLSQSAKTGRAEENFISKTTREKIQTTLLKNFVQDNSHCILVGEHAFFSIDGQSEVKSFIIQIISDRSIEEDFKDITKILFRDVSPHIPIAKFTRGLHIMQDFRLSRTAIKIGDAKSGEQKEIMYIYNSSRYDLIPFNRLLSSSANFIQIGNPFVLIRFLLIDFWIIKWIFASGGINEQYSKLRLDSIREKILLLRSRLSSGKDFTTINNQYVLNNSTVRVFQDNSTEYMGFYENEDISQKEKAKDLSRKYYDYYPQDYFAKNNEYRNISKDN